MIAAMRVSSVSPIAALGRPAWFATLAGFALLCAIVAFWTAKLLAPPPATAPAVDVSAPADVGPGRAAALFGSSSGAGPERPASGNVTVVGVLSGGPRGSAILSVGGGPGRAFAVGERIDDGLTLVAVEADRVTVASGARRSEIPAPARPDPAILTAAPAR